MKTVGIAVSVLLVAFLVLAIGGGLFTLLSYAVGKVITRFTGLDSLPATAISMAGMFLFGILVERAFNSIISVPGRLSRYDESDEGEEEEDYFDLDEESDLSDKDMDAVFAGIPRWRRPLKPLDFSDVKPDDRCPCGSGRKFKNCHGKKTKQVS